MMADRLAITKEQQPDRLAIQDGPTVNEDQARANLLDDPVEIDRGLLNSVKGMLTDPNETEAGVGAARFFSGKLDIPINNAYQLRSAIGQSLTGEDLDDTQLAKVVKDLEIEEFREPTLEQAPKQTFMGKMWDKIKYGFLEQRNIEGTIVRGPFLGAAFETADKIKEATKDDEVYRKDFKETVFNGFDMSGVSLQSGLTGKVQSVGDVIGSEQLSEWGEMMALATDKWYAENQDKQIQLIPNTGVLGVTVQAIRRPEIIVQSAVEMVPMVLEAVLGHITGAKAAKVIGKGATVLPTLGKVIGIAEPLVGANYSEARKNGLSVETAFAQSTLQGYGEAALEVWSLDANLKIFKGAGGQAVRRGLAKKTGDFLLAGGKVYGRGFTEEASQDINNRFWQLIFTDQLSVGDAIKQSITPEAFESGAIGGIMEVVAGGASASAGTVAKAVMLQTEQSKLKKIKEVRAAVEANEELSEAEKAEITAHIDEVESEVRDGPKEQTMAFETEQEAQEVAKEIEQEAVEQNKAVEVDGKEVTVTPVEEEIKPKVREEPEAKPQFELERVKGEGFVIKEIETGKEVETIAKRKPAQQRLAELNKVAEPIKPTKTTPRIIGKEKSTEVKLTEEQLLKKKLRDKQKAASIGFKAGERASREKAKVSLEALRTRKKLSDANKKEAVALVREFIKDPEDADIKARLLQQIPNVDTVRDLEKFEEKIRKGIEKAERRSAVSDVVKSIKTLKPKKMNPAFKGPAQKILDSINIATPKDEAVAKRRELIGYAEDVIDAMPEDSVTWVEANQLLERLTALEQKSINVRDLDIESLENLTNTIETLKAMDLQDKSIAEQQDVAKIRSRRKKIKKDLPDKSGSTKSVPKGVFGFLNDVHSKLENLSDNIMGGRIGTFPEWSQNAKSLTTFVYDVLDQGTDNQIRHNEAAADLSAEIVSKHNISTKDLNKTKHSFSLKDGKGAKKSFEFTQNEILSIFMHTRNPHNLASLLQNGMDRFTPREIRGGAIQERIRGFTREIVDDMISKLSTEQKSFGREIGSQLMDGLNRDAINDTSVALEGREIATVENYWPAEKSIVQKILGEEVKGVQSLIEGMGILKERVGTGNPLILRGFLETVYRSNKNVAAYSGMAPVLREVKSTLSEDVQIDFNNKGWGNEFKRIVEFVKRVEDNSPQIDPLVGFVRKKLGTFAQSRFGLNFKIAPRQYISTFLTGAYIDARYMAAFRGKHDPKLIAEISELSPQNSDRLKSNRFDRDLGDAALQAEFESYYEGKTTYESFMESLRDLDAKAIEKSVKDVGLMPMKFFDGLAIQDIYRAVKAEIADQRQDLKVDSKEYRDLLKRRFEWVIRNTQPMWHVKDRSLLGSSQDLFTRSLTMFHSQREQLVRMVGNSLVQFENSEKTAEDIARMARPVGTVLANMAVYTIYGVAWASLIQKRDKDVGSALLDFVNNIVGSFFFSQPFTETVRYIQSRQEGRQGRVRINDAFTSMTISMTTAITNYIKAIEHFAAGERYQAGPHRGEEKWKTDIVVATDQLIDVLSGLRGLPYVGPKDISNIVSQKEDKKIDRSVFR